MHRPDTSPRNRSPRPRPTKTSTEPQTQPALPGSRNPPQPLERRRIRGNRFKRSVGPLQVNGREPPQTPLEARRRNEGPSQRDFLISRKRATTLSYLRKRPSRRSFRPTAMLRVIRRFPSIYMVSSSSSRRFSMERSLFSTLPNAPSNKHVTENRLAP